MAKDFFGEWFSSDDERAFLGIAEASYDPHAPTLPQLFFIPDRDLNAFGNALLALGPEEGFGREVEDLRRGCYALLQFQDLLEVLVDPAYPVVNRHYAYYESIMYLREAVAAVLTRRALAASTLMRPWTELAVTHLYFRAREQKDGLKPYYHWLGGKSKPPFRTMVDYVFDRSPARRCVPEPRYEALRQSLCNLYRSGSSYHHSPPPSESSVVLGGGMQGTGPMAFAGALSSLCLHVRLVCQLYVISYPMCLFPVDIGRKFGVSPPVGLYFDDVSHAVVAGCLGDSSVVALRKQLGDLGEVKERLAYYHERPDVTPEVLDTQWKSLVARARYEFPAATTQDRLLTAKAQRRSFSWMTAYVGHEIETFDDVSDETIQELDRRLRDWNADW